MVLLVVGGVCIVEGGMGDVGEGGGVGVGGMCDDACGGVGDGGLCNDGGCGFVVGIGISVWFDFGFGFV